MITTGQFERAVYPALRTVIKEAEEEFAPEYSQLFNVLDTNQAYEEEWSWAGLGAPAAKPEGYPVSYSNPVTGYYKRYNQAGYGLGFRATLEMRMFEKYGILKALSSDLGEAIREGIEVILSGILNLGLTDTGPDAVVLFSASHPVLRGGLQSNVLSTLSDLSYTSYNQMLTQFETMVSNEGRKRRMTPAVLWHGPALKQKADEILQSPDRPDTGNRAKNVLRKVTPFMYHYLTSSTMWGMKATKDFTRVFFGLKPTTSKGFDFDTEDYKVKTLFMLSYGYSDYRGWVLGNS